MVAVKDRKPKDKKRAPHTRSNLPWPTGDSFQAIFARAVRRWRENTLKIESIQDAADKYGMNYQVWNRIERNISPQGITDHANYFRKISGMDHLEFVKLGLPEQPGA